MIIALSILVACIGLNILVNLKVFFEVRAMRDELKEFNNVFNFILERGFVPMKDDDPADYWKRQK